VDESHTKRRGARFAVFGCLGLLVLIVGSCVAIIIAASGGDGGSDDEYSPPQSARTAIDVETTVISQITAYPEVLDAAINRQGDDVSLVIVVGAATNEATAKNLGENFVRLYKTFSDDDPPGQTIGSGKYHYLVGVYTPTEKQIALGAKVSFADRITW